jgi:hypothetical protein
LWSLVEEVVEVHILVDHIMEQVVEVVLVVLELELVYL